MDLEQREIYGLLKHYGERLIYANVGTFGREECAKLIARLSELQESLPLLPERK